MGEIHTVTCAIHVKSNSENGIKIRWFLPRDAIASAVYAVVM